MFQIYNFSEGVKECCERLDMKQELLNYYIQNDEKDQVLKVCEETQNSPNANPATCGDLWIQALTYFRDLPDPLCNNYLERALSALSFEKDKGKDSKKDEILSPLLVLEILQSKPKLKFSVIKKYLLGRLEVQDRLIRKNNKQVDENLKKIEQMNLQIKDLQTQPKIFNPKKCDSCQHNLSLPTIHFMCGHTYHDQCIEADNGKRFCTSCYNEFKDTADKKDQYDLQAKNPQQF